MTANPITEALLAAIRHSPDPMVLTDPSAADHPMIAVNDAFVALTGYAPDAAVGRNCRFLQGSETDPEAPRRIRRCLAEQRGCIEWLVNYRRDGTVFWNLLFLSPVFDRDGTLLHFFGNQRDITGGQPADLVEYSLGKADMPAEGRRAFDALLPEILEETHRAAAGDASGQLLSRRLIEAVARLNEVTIQLTAATWTMRPA